jgi:hypothetical protein
MELLRAAVYNEPLVFGMQRAVDRQSVAQSVHLLRYTKTFNELSRNGRLANECAKFFME